MNGLFFVWSSFVRCHNWWTWWSNSISKGFSSFFICWLIANQDRMSSMGQQTREEWERERANDRKSTTCYSTYTCICFSRISIATGTVHRIHAYTHIIISACAKKTKAKHAHQNTIQNQTKDRCIFAYQRCVRLPLEFR